MIIAIIVLAVISLVAICMLMLQRKELRNLAEEINVIRKMDSNQKLHKEAGLVDGRLIEEINKLLGELRDIRIHYQRRNHEVEQMMTNIAHDLRTPLTSALGYIDMMGNENISEEERKEERAIVEKRLKRLQELIDSFFEFSKVISRNEALAMSEINAVSVLQESIVNYYDDYCSRGRSIVLKCDTQRIAILSNRNMLMRIFDNLINNSLKHGEGDLTIEVDRGVEHRITVSFRNQLRDPQLDISRVFDEFYTTDISRTKGNTGLGLAIVKQFTELIGGGVAASNDSGDFCVEIVLGLTKSGE